MRKVYIDTSALNRIFCDERVIKKYKGRLVVMNPVDYIRKILQRGESNKE